MGAGAGGGRTGAEARSRILAAARALFAERGYAATRVADVARRAGMSPANVYWHVESKEALLRDVLADGFAAVEAMTAQAAAAPGSTRERLEGLVERTVALYDERADFSLILGGLMGPGGQDLVRSLGFDMREIGGRYHANLAPLLDQARREGLVPDVDPNLLVAFYFAFFNGFLITYADLWSGVPRDAIRDAALRLIGAAPAAGSGGKEGAR